MYNIRVNATCFGSTRSCHKANKTLKNCYVRRIILFRELNFTNIIKVLINIKNYLILIKCDKIRGSKYRIRIIRIRNSRAVFPDESMGFLGGILYSNLLQCVLLIEGIFKMSSFLVFLIFCFEELITNLHKNCVEHYLCAHK